MQSPDLETKLAALESLPALPLALQQVQKIIRNPKSSMQQIATVIAEDPALASKTIKLVNSAFYGLSKPVSSITQAITILGLNAVNHLMLGLTMVKIFGNTKSQTFDHDAFWEHAFGTALIAKSIAEFVRYPDPQECFVGGLLHDMGRLVLEQFLHDDFAKAFEESAKKNIPLSHAEINMFGADHAYAGGFLAKKWKIPPELIISIQYHHSISEIPPQMAAYALITTIVSKANQISNKEKLGSDFENNPEPDDLFQLLHIPSEEISKIVVLAKSEISSTIKQWRK